MSNAKASEFGLKAHPELTSLCAVDVQEEIQQQNFLRSLHG